MTIWPITMKFVCNACLDIEQNIMYNALDDLMSSMQVLGWPICPECGEDMEWVNVDV